MRSQRGVRGLMSQRGVRGLRSQRGVRGMRSQRSQRRVRGLMSQKSQRGVRGRRSQRGVRGLRSQPGVCEESGVTDPVLVDTWDVVKTVTICISCFIHRRIVEYFIIKEHNQYHIRVI